MPRKHEELFRPEALEAYNQNQQYSAVLRISPSWTHSLFWLVLVASVFFVAFGLFGRVFEYATGPAVIRLEGRTELPVQESGVVTAVEARPGQRVEQGQVLVRLSDTTELADLERFTREFELQLTRRLTDLNDEGARSALTSLRAQQELARARLSSRNVLAPHAGVVSDVRIREGQHLVAGEVALSILEPSQRLTVTAMLPGEYRPLLRAGGSMRLEVRGFAYQYQELVIDSVGEELVGPSAVRRYLGPELGESFTVEGAVVLVQAHVPRTSFEVEGEQLDYFDGMLGQAQARVKSERLLVLLVPALKAFLP
ncbi:HlyD family efflux transporter periplasmic adaptor subunit [Corallococcus praedator]|uniref:HlyD family efflux transporter periplasmic adaptor subunit n=1 Tax=Corallococcus praedator TaxID=2316724 RepID=A0ABX9QQU0_9BACT|nr:MULTISPECIES: HlyD family efflux transporter periplasmic adaptor subunit [Corallococcus]RKH35261.1 HlyD family efflux transporter periplasmic adaptor subunit [Corallococcus sp. CA031C]RKI16408.1 HlyD family efflux transporter periplasmic adaptor subunit [Corallococcus praedator]